MDHLEAYRDFIARKGVATVERGFEARDLPAKLFGHQRHMVEFATRVGSTACFYDTGLGKSAIELAWADQVARHTGKPVMILTPLAVGPQIVKEAENFGIDGAAVVRQQSDVRGVRIAVTNYERMHLFSPASFGGVVLDESSIVKGFGGAMSRKLMAAWARHPYRLCGTATPAPNDYMELGQHSEFLGALPRQDMLTRWFIHDSSDTSKWRMKRHAVMPFWRWVASWAQAARRPSDVGPFSDAGYDLPPYRMTRHMVATDITADAADGMLFRMPDNSATSIHKEKRRTVADRAGVVADLVRADPGESWLVWCDTDYEANALVKALPEAVEVRGSHPPERKERALVGFAEGDVRVLVTKPRIAGFGLNYQHCARMAFAGLSFSYEAFYQAVRRCWRYGQTRELQVHVALADTETTIWQTIARKRDEHDEMSRRMVAVMQEAGMGAVVRRTYNGSTIEIPAFMRGEDDETGEDGPLRALSR